MSRQRIFAAVLLLAMAVPASAHFGVFKNKERFPIHHPPEVKLPATVGLEVESPRDIHLIRANMAALLAPLGISFGPSETQITVVVSRFDGDVRDVRITHSARVHTGDNTETDSKGRTKKIPICKQIDAAMIQRQWRGEINLLLQVRDLGREVNLLSRPIRGAYSKDALVAGPDVKGCESWSYGAPEDAPTSREAVRRVLLDGAMQTVANHLTGWTEVRDALLAVCDELKPGNAKARAGDLEGAIEAWTAARAKEDKPDKVKHLDAYREYNIAVATMLMASSATDPAQARAQLDEAWQHFEKAQAGQPGEKYFTSPNEFPADFAAVKEVVERAATEQPRTDESPREVQTNNPWLNRPLDPGIFPDSETAEISKFRRIVRERLALLTRPEQTDAPELAAEFDRYAARIGVNAEQQAEVTRDEKVRCDAVRAALGDYDQALERILQGRKNVRLTTTEARRLDLELETLQLTRAMVQPLEAARGITREPQ